MLHSVRLDQLPNGLQFPTDLSHKVSYSAERRELQFSGFMSKTDFDKLSRLSNDLAYQKALEQLFKECTFSATNSAAPAKSKKPLILNGIAAIVVVAIFLVGWSMWRSSDTLQEEQSTLHPMVDNSEPVPDLTHASLSSDSQDSPGDQEFARESDSESDSTQNLAH